ncbi:hypothetical protein AAHC03_0207 [Spirometra sp. Aus1]
MLAAIRIAETGTREDVENFLFTESAIKRDVDNNTLLHYACLAGNLDSVVALINGGYYVNAPNVEGHTPICDAAIHGSPDVIRYLIQNGANVNPPAYWGSPLNYAVRNGRFHALVLLINGGADINACDRTGFCAIHVAVENKLYDAAEYLLMSGADPNRRVRLTTPLHMAAKQQDLRLVRLLLSHGASPYPADADGLKPLDYSPKGSDVHHLISSHMGWVPSLQFLTRIAIKGFLPSFRQENIRKLPLPQHLRDYLTFKF